MTGKPVVLQPEMTDPLAPQTRHSAVERHARLLKLLAQSGVASVPALAETLAVSEMTIRRDLIALAQQGRLQRTHGGAMLMDADSPVTIDRVEPRFDARLLQHYDAKQRIASVAAELAARYRTLAMDVGSSTLLTAQRLTACSHLKIFTNSVRIAQALKDAQPEVYLAGGRMRLDEMSTGGPTAVQQFTQLWFDVAFIGVSGLTAEGIYDYSFDDADLKRVYLQRANLTVVLCDASKFQRRSLVHIAALDDIDMLITEQAPPPALAAVLAAANIEVIIAPCHNAGRPSLPDPTKTS